MSSGIRLAAVNALPCSFNLSSAISIPYVSSRPISPQRDNIAAFVPFSWEVKPGISKRFEDDLDNRASSKLSSNKQPGCQKLFIDDLDVLPLPMPPRMQNPSGFEVSPARIPDSPSWSRLYAQKILVGSSPSAKRQPRKYTAEDDPFYRAMKACTTRNKDESKGSHEPAKSVSRGTLSEKLIETEVEQRSKPNKTNGSRVSHSFSPGGKPAFGMSVGHGNRGQLLVDRGHGSVGHWKYTEQKNSSTSGIKSGVMVLSQRRLMLGNCLGCRNPDSFEPSAILARTKAATSS